MEGGYAQMALFSQDFYTVLDEVLIDLLENKDLNLQKLERFSQQLKRRPQQPFEKFEEQDHVLRLLYLAKAHRLLAQTRRLSYDKQLEIFISENFYPYEVDLLNSLHEVSHDKNSVRRLCLNYLERIDECKFKIFFDDGLLSELPFNQPFFFAIVSGLKLYIIGHRKCPHVIQFKSELSAIPNICHPNAIVAFLRDLGRLHRKSFSLVLPENHIDLAPQTAHLFRKLRSAFHASGLDTWYDNFTPLFRNYLEQFQIPFTYHNKRIITPGYCQPNRDFTLTINGKSILVKLISTEKDVACYVKLMKQIHQEAIRLDIDRPEISNPCQENGHLIFSIELSTEEQVETFYDFLESHLAQTTEPEIESHSNFSLSQ